MSGGSPPVPPGTPTGPVPVPGEVEALAAGTAVEVAWVNELGGTTWRLDGGRRYVKWAPAGSGLDVVGEADRLRWAGRFTPVPAVVEAGSGPGGEWLVTDGIAAVSAVAPPWPHEPAVAVRAVGEGLRTWHDRLPVADCPWTWSAESRLARVGPRLAEPDTWNPFHAAMGRDRVLAVLAEIPTVDRSVVAHGDACCPNTLVDGAGRYVAHVDVGHLGVADRWADLAVAVWSTEWNYGPGWEQALLDAYGVADDPDRRRWYRLLWDLSD